MRLPATAMALVALATLAFGVWASGCTGLSNDCELNLNCPSTAPPPSCEGPFFSPTCDACLQSACCQELADCDDEGACVGLCLFGFMPLPPECNAGQTKERFDRLVQCMSTSCAAECAPADQCNPVTTFGCKEQGSTCELVFPGIFACIPPYDDLNPTCGECDIQSGPICDLGNRCYGDPGTCARFCCNDADCGTGRCELDPIKAFGVPLAIPEDKLGVCLNMDSSMGPACDAPAMVPSNGTCFGGFAPM